MDARGAGMINWKLRHFLILGDPAKSFSTGVITPWCKQRELALGGRTCSSEGHSREQGQVWAVSVGDRGLELLQAAPAEFCSIRLSIFRKVLCCAH